MTTEAQKWHIAALFAFPTISVLGLVAAVLLSSARNSSYVTYGNVFSVGLLLAGAIVHALGETSEMMEEIRETDGEATDFPINYTVFGATVVFLVGVEACVERYVDIHFGGNNFLHGHDETKEASSEHEKVSQEQETSSGGAGEAGNKETEASSDHENVSEDEEVWDADSMGKPSKSAQRRSSWLVTAPRPSIVQSVTAPVKQQHRRRSTFKELFVYEDDDTKKQKEVHEHSTHQGFNPWAGILLTVVMCIHVLIEGVNFGATNDEDVLLSFFIVICVHKLFASFALGSSLIASGLWDRPKDEGGRTMFYILTGIFLALTMVGVGIGMAIAELADGFAVVILTSMTGGSFLFVALCEVLPGELEKTRVYQFPIGSVVFSLCLGYTAMTLLVLAEPEEGH